MHPVATTKLSPSTFHVLMAHYGDAFWLEGSVILWSKISQITDISISFPKSQTSDSDLTKLVDRLSLLAPKIRINGFLVEEHEIDHASYHHAFAIEQLRALSNLESSHVIVADPDAWVVGTWEFNQVVQRISADFSVFVADHIDKTKTHPCCAILPLKNFMSLDLFSEMQNFENDFARNLDFRLTSALNPIFLFFGAVLQPVAIFSEDSGLYYPQLGILHFSSSSFVGSKWTRQSLLPARRAAPYMNRVRAQRIQKQVSLGRLSNRAVFFSQKLTVGDFLTGLKMSFSAQK